MNKILRNPHQLRRRNLLFCIIKSVNGFSTKSCVEDGSATVANISLIGESSDVTHTGLKLPPIWGVSRKAISLCDGNGPVILAISYFLVCNQLPRYVDEKPRLRSALTRSFMHPIKFIHIGVNFIAFYFRQKKSSPRVLGGSGKSCNLRSAYLKVRTDSPHRFKPHGRRNMSRMYFPRHMLCLLPYSTHGTT